MLFRKNFIWLLAASMLLSMAVGVMLGCDSNDKSTTPVEFTYPHVYTGTYKAVQNWMQSDSSWTLCTATFTFANDYTFTIKIDTASCVGDFNPCSAKGTYSFNGDSLFIEIDNENYWSELCSIDFGSVHTAEYDPDKTGYRYIIDDDYIVFECRGVKYRKIEFYGR
ncbi:MAG: hypothetical protein AB1746_04270 [Candidatus Zixiibacteriota bacterium]